MYSVIGRETHTIVQDDMVRGVFGNKLLGNVDLRFGPAEEVAANRQTALAALLGRSTLEHQLVTMLPVGKPGFIDLADQDDPQAIPPTDGLITTDPRTILSGNPADCEMIAMYGVGSNRQRVLGLIHAGREITEAGGHIDALHYLHARYGLRPAYMRIVFAPSVRAESYKFSHLPEAQIEDPNWGAHLWKDGESMWHVDVHGRVAKELRAEGVLHENMYDGSIDVGADPNYFSHTQYKQGQARGRNAVMVHLLD